MKRERERERERESEALRPTIKIFEQPENEKKMQNESPINAFYRLHNASPMKIKLSFTQQWQLLS